jgi:hypothetical protein
MSGDDRENAIATDDLNAPFGRGSGKQAQFSSAMIAVHIFHRWPATLRPHRLLELPIQQPA